MNFRFYRLIFCQCTAALANAALRFALSLHLYLVVCGKIYGTLARRYFPILVGKWRRGSRFCSEKMILRTALPKYEIFITII